MTVVLVPGFTQTAASWSAVAPHVPGSRAVDVPLRESFAATANALGDANGDAIYVGYSLGGRLTLQLALDRPDIVRGLVLVSAAPGLSDARARADRVAADEELARRVERDGVDAFLEYWLAQPMFATVPPDAPGVADRRTLTPEFVAGCLRVLGTGAMEPLWGRLHRLRMPVALVTGTKDPKFTAIAQQMVEHIDTGVLHLQLDGGHALPLECPAELGEFLAVFAAEHEH